jgi:hypothetical protein
MTAEAKGHGAEEILRSARADPVLSATTGCLGAPRVQCWGSADQFQRAARKPRTQNAGVMEKLTETVASGSKQGLRSHTGASVIATEAFARCLPRRDVCAVLDLDFF